MMTPARYAFLADALLVLHMAYAWFILLGLLAIAVGALARWRWVRNRWFRGAHLGAMGIVVLESLAGIFCPLTEWEYALRLRAGQPLYGEKSFISHWAERWFYFDWSEATYLALYAAVFAAMLAALLFVPADWRGKGR
jgi:hypothetical protein